MIPGIYTFVSRTAAEEREEEEVTVVVCTIPLKEGASLPPAAAGAAGRGLDTPEPSHSGSQQVDTELLRQLYVRFPRAFFVLVGPPAMGSLFATDSSVSPSPASSRETADAPRLLAYDVVQRRTCQVTLAATAAAQSEDTLVVEASEQQRHSLFLPPAHAASVLQQQEWIRMLHQTSSSLTSVQQVVSFLLLHCFSVQGNVGGGQQLGSASLTAVGAGSALPTDQLLQLLTECAWDSDANTVQALLSHLAHHRSVYLPPRSHSRSSSDGDDALCLTMDTRLVPTARPSPSPSIPPDTVHDVTLELGISLHPSTNASRATPAAMVAAPSVSAPLHVEAPVPLSAAASLDLLVLATSDFTPTATPERNGLCGTSVLQRLLRALTDSLPTQSPQPFSRTDATRGSPSDVVYLTIGGDVVAPSESTVLQAQEALRRYEQYRHQHRQATANAAAVTKGSTTATPSEVDDQRVNTMCDMWEQCSVLLQRRQASLYQDQLRQCGGTCGEVNRRQTAVLLLLEPEEVSVVRHAGVLPFVRHNASFLHIPVYIGLVLPAATTAVETAPFGEGTCTDLADLFQLAHDTDGSVFTFSAPTAVSRVKGEWGGTGSAGEASAAPAGPSVPSEVSLAAASFPCVVCDFYDEVQRWRSRRYTDVHLCTWVPPWVHSWKSSAQSCGSGDETAEHTRCLLLPCLGAQETRVTPVYVCATVSLDPMPSAAADNVCCIGVAFSLSTQRYVVTPAQCCNVAALASDEARRQRWSPYAQGGKSAADGVPGPLDQSVWWQAQLYIHHLLRQTLAEQRARLAVLATAWASPSASPPSSGTRALDAKWPTTSEDHSEAARTLATSVSAEDTLLATWQATFPRLIDVRRSPFFLSNGGEACVRVVERVAGVMLASSSSSYGSPAIALCWWRWAEWNLRWWALKESRYTLDVGSVPSCTQRAGTTSKPPFLLLGTGASAPLSSVTEPQSDRMPLSSVNGASPPPRVAQPKATPQHHVGRTHTSPSRRVEGEQRNDFDEATERSGVRRSVSSSVHDRSPSQLGRRTSAAVDVSLPSDASGRALGSARPFFSVQLPSSPLPPPLHPYSPPPREDTEDQLKAASPFVSVRSSRSRAFDVTGATLELGGHSPPRRTRAAAAAADGDAVGEEGSYRVAPPCDSPTQPCTPHSSTSPSETMFDVPMLHTVKGANDDHPSHRTPLRALLPPPSPSRLNASPRPRISTSVPSAHTTEQEAAPTVGLPSAGNRSEGELTAAVRPATSTEFATDVFLPPAPSTAFTDELVPGTVASPPVPASPAAFCDLRWCVFGSPSADSNGDDGGVQVVSSLATLLRRTLPFAASPSSQLIRVQRFHEAAVELSVRAMKPALLSPTLTERNRSGAVAVVQLFEVDRTSGRLHLVDQVDSLSGGSTASEAEEVACSFAHLKPAQPYSVVYVGLARQPADASPGGQPVPPLPVDWIHVKDIAWMDGVAFETPPATQVRQLRMAACDATTVTMTWEGGAAAKLLLTPLLTPTASPVLEENKADTGAAAPHEPLRKAGRVVSAPRSPAMVGGLTPCAVYLIKAVAVHPRGNTTATTLPPDSVAGSATSNVATSSLALPVSLQVVSEDHTEVAIAATSAVVDAERLTVTRVTAEEAEEEKREDVGAENAAETLPSGGGAAVGVEEDATAKKAGPLPLVRVALAYPMCVYRGVCSTSDVAALRPWFPSEVQGKAAPCDEEKDVQSCRTSLKLSVRPHWRGMGPSSTGLPHPVRAILSTADSDDLRERKWEASVLPGLPIDLQLVFEVSVEVEWRCKPPCDATSRSVEGGLLHALKTEDANTTVLHTFHALSCTATSALQMEVGPFHVVSPVVKVPLVTQSRAELLWYGTTREYTVRVQPPIASDGERAMQPPSETTMMSMQQSNKVSTLFSEYVVAGTACSTPEDSVPRFCATLSLHSLHPATRYMAQLRCGNGADHAGFPCGHGGRVRGASSGGVNQAGVTFFTSPSAPPLDVASVAFSTATQQLFLRLGRGDSRDGTGAAGAADLATADRTPRRVMATVQPLNAVVEAASGTQSSRRHVIDCTNVPTATPLVISLVQEWAFPPTTMLANGMAAALPPSSTGVAPVSREAPLPRRSLPSYWYVVRHLDCHAVASLASSSPKARRTLPSSSSSALSVARVPFDSTRGGHAVGEVEFTWCSACPALQQDGSVTAASEAAADSTALPSPEEHYDQTHATRCGGVLINGHFFAPTGLNTLRMTRKQLMHAAGEYLRERRPHEDAITNTVVEAGENAVQSVLNEQQSVWGKAVKVSVVGPGVVSELSPFYLLPPPQPLPRGSYAVHVYSSYVQVYLASAFLRHQYVAALGDGEEHVDGDRHDRVDFADLVNVYVDVRLPSGEVQSRLLPRATSPPPRCAPLVEGQCCSTPELDDVWQLALPAQRSDDAQLFLWLRVEVAKHTASDTQSARTEEGDGEDSSGSVPPPSKPQLLIPYPTPCEEEEKVTRVAVPPAQPVVGLRLESVLATELTFSWQPSLWQPSPHRYGHPSRPSSSSPLPPAECDGAGCDRWRGGYVIVVMEACPCDTADNAGDRCVTHSAPSEHAIATNSLLFPPSADEKGRAEAEEQRRRLVQLAKQRRLTVSERHLLYRLLASESGGHPRHEARPSSRPPPFFLIYTTQKTSLTVSGLHPATPYSVIVHGSGFGDYTAEQHVVTRAQLTPAVLQPLLSSLAVRVSPISPSFTAEVPSANGPKATTASQLLRRRRGGGSLWATLPPSVETQWWLPPPATTSPDPSPLSPAEVTWTARVARLVELRWANPALFTEANSITGGVDEHAHSSPIDVRMDDGEQEKDVLVVTIHTPLSAALVAHTGRVLRQWDSRDAEPVVMDATWEDTDPPTLPRRWPHVELAVVATVTQRAGRLHHPEGATRGSVRTVALLPVQREQVSMMCGGRTVWAESSRAAVDHARVDLLGGPRLVQLTPMAATLSWEASCERHTVTWGLCPPPSSPAPSAQLQQRTVTACSMSEPPLVELDLTECYADYRRQRGGGGQRSGCPVVLIGVQSEANASNVLAMALQLLPPDETIFVLRQSVDALSLLLPNDAEGESEGERGTSQANTPKPDAIESQDSTAWESAVARQWSVVPRRRDRRPTRDVRVVRREPSPHWGLAGRVVDVWSAFTAAGEDGWAAETGVEVPRGSTVEKGGAASELQRQARLFPLSVASLVEVCVRSVVCTPHSQYWRDAFVALMSSLKVCNVSGSRAGYSTAGKTERALALSHNFLYWVNPTVERRFSVEPAPLAARLHSLRDLRQVGRFLEHQSAYAPSIGSSSQEVTDGVSTTALREGAARAEGEEEEEEGQDDYITEVDKADAASRQELDWLDSLLARGCPLLATKLTWESTDTHFTVDVIGPLGGMGSAGASANKEVDEKDDGAADVISLRRVYELMLPGGQQDPLVSPLSGGSAGLASPPSQRVNAETCRAEVWKEAPLIAASQQAGRHRRTCFVRPRSPFTRASASVSMMLSHLLPEALYRVQVSSPSSGDAVLRMQFITPPSHLSAALHVHRNVDGTQLRMRVRRFGTPHASCLLLQDAHTPPVALVLHAQSTLVVNSSVGDVLLERCVYDSEAGPLPDCAAPKGEQHDHASAGTVVMSDEVGFDMREVQDSASSLTLRICHSLSAAIVASTFSSEEDPSHLRSDVGSDIRRQLLQEAVWGPLLSNPSTNPRGYQVVKKRQTRARGVAQAMTHMVQQSSVEVALCRVPRLPHWEGVQLVHRGPHSLQLSWRWWAAAGTADHPADAIQPPLLRLACTPLRHTPQAASSRVGSSVLVEKPSALLSALQPATLYAVTVEAEEAAGKERLPSPFRTGPGSPQSGGLSRALPRAGGRIVRASAEPAAGNGKTDPVSGEAGITVLRPPQYVVSAARELAALSARGSPLLVRVEDEAATCEGGGWCHASRRAVLSAPPVEPAATAQARMKGIRRVPGRVYVPLDVGVYPRDRPPKRERSTSAAMPRASDDVVVRYTMLLHAPVGVLYLPRIIWQWSAQQAAPEQWCNAMKAVEHASGKDGAAEAASLNAALVSFWTRRLHQALALTATPSSSPPHMMPPPSPLSLHAVCVFPSSATSAPHGDASVGANASLFAAMADARPGTALQELIGVPVAEPTTLRDVAERKQLLYVIHAVHVLSSLAGEGNRRPAEDAPHRVLASGVELIGGELAVSLSPPLLVRPLRVIRQLSMRCVTPRMQAQWRPPAPPLGALQSAAAITDRIAEGCALDVTWRWALDDVSDGGHGHPAGFGASFEQFSATVSCEQVPSAFIAYKQLLAQTPHHGQEESEQRTQRQTERGTTRARVLHWICEEAAERGPVVFETSVVNGAHAVHIPALQPATLYRVVVHNVRYGDAIACLSCAALALTPPPVPELPLLRYGVAATPPTTQATPSTTTTTTAGSAMTVRFDLPPARCSPQGLLLVQWAVLLCREEVDLDACIDAVDYLAAARMTAAAAAGLGHHVPQPAIPPADRPRRRRSSSPGPVHTLSSPAVLQSLSSCTLPQYRVYANPSTTDALTTTLTLPPRPTPLSYVLVFFATVGLQQDGRARERDSGRFPPSQSPAAGLGGHSVSLLEPIATAGSPSPANVLGSGSGVATDPVSGGLGERLTTYSLPVVVEVVHPGSGTRNTEGGGAGIADGACAQSLAPVETRARRRLVITPYHLRLVRRDSRVLQWSWSIHLGALRMSHDEWRRLMLNGVFAVEVTALNATAVCRPGSVSSTPGVRTTAPAAKAASVGAHLPSLAHASPSPPPPPSFSPSRGGRRRHRRQQDGAATNAMAAVAATPARNEHVPFYRENMVVVAPSHTDAVEMDGPGSSDPRSASPTASSELFYVKVSAYEPHTWQRGEEERADEVPFVAPGEDDDDACFTYHFSLPCPTYTAAHAAYTVRVRCLPLGTDTEGVRSEGHLSRGGETEPATLVPGPWSDLLQLPPVRVPSPVQRVRVGHVTPTTIEVSWSDPQLDSTAGVLTYWIRYSLVLREDDETAARGRRCGAENGDGSTPPVDTIERHSPTSEATTPTSSDTASEGHEDMDSSEGEAVDEICLTGQTSVVLKGLSPCSTYRVEVVPCNELGERCPSFNAVVTACTL